MKPTQGNLLGFSDTRLEYNISTHRHYAFFLVPFFKLCKSPLVISSKNLFSPVWIFFLVWSCCVSKINFPGFPSPLHYGTSCFGLWAVLVFIVKALPYLSVSDAWSEASLCSSGTLSIKTSVPFSSTFVQLLSSAWQKKKITIKLHINKV